MQKPKRLRLIILILCVVGLGAICLFAHRPDKIDVNATYNAENRTLSVTETLSLTNTTGHRLKEWVFNLYPNAYADEKTAPIQATDKKFAYPNGFSSGSAEVFSVSCGKYPCDWTLSGTQKTLLRVQLPRPVPIGGSVSLTVTYSVTLPDSRLNLGYSQKDVRLCSAFLLPAVYDRENRCFFTDDVPPIGDYVFSQAAAFDVTLTAPEQFVVAGTGCVSCGKGVWRMTGENLRDVCLVLSPDYEVLQKERGGLRFSVFAKTPESAETLLTLSEKILSNYIPAFGNFPYPELTIATASLCKGSYATSGMVILDDVLVRSDPGMLEYTLANALAHQWFGACVGSDPIRHPAQEEALCTFAALYHFEQTYGKSSFDSLYEGLIAPVLLSPRFADISPDQPLSAFTSDAAYEAVVCRKGAAAVQSKREALGDEAFFSALREYILKNKFKIAE